MSAPQPEGATPDPSPFTPHLKPGENLLWSARYSDKLRRASQGRTFIRRLLFAIVSAIVALISAYRLYEALTTQTGAADLVAAVAIPLYISFGLAAACLCVFLLLRLKPEPAHADHYAATNLRLIALNPAGAIVDEIAGADIGGATFDPNDPPRELHIYGRDDTVASFHFEHLPDLRTVRARIAEIFPEAET